MPFSIPFAGGSLPLFSSRPSRWSRYEPFSFTSRTSTRFTTLAPRSSALRHAAFARSRGGGPYGSHNLLLGLSMLSMLPLALDIMYRNPRAVHGTGTRQMSIAVDEILAREAEAEEEAAFQSIEHEPVRSQTLDEDYQGAPDALHSSSAAADGSKADWKHSHRSIPSALPAAVSSSPDPSCHIVEIASSMRSAKTTASGRTRLNVTRKMADTLVNRTTHLSKELRRQCEEGLPLETQIETAQLLLAGLRGIVRVNQERQRDPLYRVKPNVVVQAIKGLLGVLVQLQGVDAPAFRALQEQLIAFMREPSRADRIGHNGKSTGGLPSVALRHIARKALQLGALQLQVESLRHLLALSTASCESEHEAANLLYETAVSIPDLIRSGWLQTPDTHGQQPSTSAEATLAYARCLDLLETREIGNGAVMSGILILALQMSAADLDNTLSGTEGLFDTCNAGGELVKRTRSLLNGLISGLTAPMSHSSLPSGTLVTLLRDRQSLSLLLQFAYRHLQSWTASEQVYSLLQMHHPPRQLPEARKFSKMSVEAADEALAAAQGDAEAWVDIESEHLRAATLLRQPGTAVAYISAQLFKHLAVLTSPDGTSIALEEYTSAAEIAERQVELLLRLPAISRTAISAVLSHWTVTSQFNHVLLFVNRFLGLRTDLREREVDCVRLLEALDSRKYGLAEDEDGQDAMQQQAEALLAAREAAAQLTATPHIWVNLLNAARKYGNISLCEKLWLAACEDESTPRKKPWVLPAAAYTVMLRLYEAEARLENLAAIRSGTWRKMHKSGKYRISYMPFAARLRVVRQPLQPAPSQTPDTKKPALHGCIRRALDL